MNIDKKNKSTVKNPTKKINKKYKIKKSEFNKIEKLILRLDELENSFVNIPKNINSSLKAFVTNNKYILIALVALVLATLGYNTYNYATNVVAPSSSKISKTINDLYKLIEIDDSELNETQQLFKYMYLYLITKPTNPDYASKLKVLYNSKTNFYTDDLSSKIINKFSEKLNPVGNVKENVVQGVTNTIESVGNVFSSLSSKIGYLFAGSIVDKYKNRDVFDACYYSLNNGQYFSVNEFLEKFDLAEEIFKTKIDSCYNVLLESIGKYTNSSKTSECIPINYKSNLLLYLSHNYNNKTALEKFNTCYYGGDIYENIDIKDIL